MSKPQTIEECDRFREVAEELFARAESGNDSSLLAKSLDMTASALEVLETLRSPGDSPGTTEYCMLMNVQGRGKVLEHYLHADAYGEF